MRCGRRFRRPTAPASRRPSAPSSVRAVAVGAVLALFCAVLLLLVQVDASLFSYAVSAPYDRDDLAHPHSHGNFSGQKSLDGSQAARSYDDRSCLSRHQSARYWRESKHRPSSCLQHMLREYEALHRRCAPNTESYNRSVHQVSTRDPTSSDCKYVVWIPSYGLGNRMLTLASTFMYALLTRRVLLITGDSDMPDLFCEPFPEGTWVLPTTFPFLNEFKGLDHNSPRRYENFLRNKVVQEGEKNPNNGTSMFSLPEFVYANLILHGNDTKNKNFFCEQDQLRLQRFSFMALSSNVYFVPSLFAIPSFREQLGRLFPRKDTVFHHLSRYLFHPADPVWDLIARYHQAHFANADERIGLQIRIFNSRRVELQCVLNQILSCMSWEKLLPDVVNLQQRHGASSTSSNESSTSRPSKAVLVASLSPWFSEKMRETYSNHSSVSVHQPSHEERQQTRSHRHNVKALVEIYLLSFTDVLVTTRRSTFGYVAHGLGGLQPLILSQHVKCRSTNPPCCKDVSMEPCLIFQPEYDCGSNQGVRGGIHLPYTRQCVDVDEGAKLVLEMENT